MSKQRPHMLIMAGGTGGHVFPALAVAIELRKKGADVVWLGTRQGIEASVAPKNKFEIEWLKVKGLRGKSWQEKLLFPVLLAQAIIQSIGIIRKHSPVCVLGMGGFVSGPGAIAAILLRVPLIIHEQNAVAGLTNKVLARFATHALTGFEEVEGMPKTAKWVGNPVRNSIRPAQRMPDKRVLNVLVLGGSQGAMSLNRHLPPLLSRFGSAVQVWHQTGWGRDAKVIEQYEKLGVRAKVTEFVDKMELAYLWADIVICRAGAMTIAELCAAAKPSLLVPYPHAAGDHQSANAMALVDAGAALMISDRKLANARTLVELKQLIAKRNVLPKMGRKALDLHNPKARRKVAKICLRYLHA